ncbi:MAG: hypothetical protein GIKADHBN_00492 [Phycisphaerales bacterium]|nr:hypothetical protein [Phycisphaerales bacterium]MCK6475236.1 DinB family protein [Phycisphaerales bacterium]
MGAFAESVVAAGKRSRGLAERLLKDVRPDQFARKPHVGGVIIDTNHPSFVFGHLALYPAKIAQIIGADPAPVAAPAAFEGLFKNGAPCHDDPSGTIYPGMEAVVSAFFRSYDGVFPLVAALSDAEFAKENPDPRYREFLPTVGQAAVFLLNNHTMMHLGQISAWRRCMGLGPA